MTSVSVCGECNGKGNYKILNAYDPEFEETVICEYCDGDGVVYSAVEFTKAAAAGKTQDDDWFN